MIRLTGSVLLGLDEFMLRTGHLKVLCNVGSESGGSRTRIERETAEWLTRLVEVPPMANGAVAEYLRTKKLCPASVEEGKLKEFRYPDLLIEADADQALSLRSLTEAQPSIWWQDLCFASPEVVSKVGTITATAKAGGKTGLSHIFDWAEQTGFLSRTAQLTVAGRLLPKIGAQTEGMKWLRNPYALGNEKILLAFAFFQEDVDVFARLIVRLKTASFPLKKRAAMQMFAELVAAINEESESARYLTSRQQFQIAELVRDLEHAARRGRTSVAEHSTTWHRAASRLESLVDFGLLTKQLSDGYEYVYSGTKSLGVAATSLEAAVDAAEWLSNGFAEAIFGKPINTESVDPEGILMELTGLLGNPMFALHIDSLALALMARLADEGKVVSLQTARSSIEDFARRVPEKARLARGTSGERAEFVSFAFRATAKQ